MATNKCSINEVINDYMVFCWYRGCWPQQFLTKLEYKWLYILRAINDAAIVWYEGIGEIEDPEESSKAWVRLSLVTGKSVAVIIQDLTGFKPISREEMV